MRGTILNFSPNKSGSSSFVAEQISKKLKKYINNKLNINDYKITPCGSCVDYCSNYANCKIKDDMIYLYKRLELDDFFVIVTPVYFYHIPGYAKIMIDRCQPYWVRKYILKKSGFKERLGFVICIAATKGKKLFSGIDLTMRYFFDIFNLKFDRNFNLYIKNVERKENIDIRKLENFCNFLEEKIINFYKS